jgi:DNA end-binding protein Ku
MPRPIWSGAISFGLVNVPVKLYTATREHDVGFHLLSPDGKCRLRRKLYCPETGEEFDFNQTARGYEVSPGQYVLVKDEELDKLRPEAGRTINIVDFVDQSQIDPLYYDKPYYLVPSEAGARAYRLLLEAMKKQEKVAIAKFTMRSKEYLAALRPEGRVMCLETMRYSDEVVPVEDIEGVPGKVEVNKREVETAEKLIEALVEDFKPEKYKDQYRDRVAEMLEGKKRGEEVRQVADEEEPPRIINLMEALEKSLKETRSHAGGSKRPTSKRRKSA